MLAAFPYKSRCRKSANAGVPSHCAGIRGQSAGNMGRSRTRLWKPSRPHSSHWCSAPCVRVTAEMEFKPCWVLMWFGESSLCTDFRKLAPYQLKCLAGESLTQAVVSAVGGQMMVVPGFEKKDEKFL